MKLVVLTCVEEHAEVARRLLKKSGILGFSESEMKGYKKHDDDEGDNWFADKHALDSAHIFFAMCENHKAEEIIDEVRSCKKENNIVNANAFVVNIESAV